MFELTPFDRRGHHHITNYNPFKELEDFEKSFFSAGDAKVFNTDICDNGDAFELTADLPGFDKKDIDVSVDGNYLTITAERSDETEQKDKKGNYIRRERSYGSFCRSFDVSNIKTDGIKVKYKDGVLTLDMPKKDAAIPSSKRLEIE